MMLLARLVSAFVVVILLAGFFTERINYQNVPINSNDRGELREIPAALAKPDGDGPFPAVVLLHHCGGPDTQSLIFWPTFLNDLGYVTLTPSSLQPRDLRNCARPIVLGRLENRIELERDAYGALEYLGQQSFIDESRVAVMGFSLGGMVIASLLHRAQITNIYTRTGPYAAASGHAVTPSGLDFAAAISVYSTCGLAGSPGSERRFLEPLPGRPKMPWLVVNGSEEGFWSTDTCRRMAGRSDLIEFHELEGVYHGFDNPNNRGATDPFGNKMLYNEEAVETTKSLVDDFLRRTLAE